MRMLALLLALAVSPTFAEGVRVEARDGWIRAAPPIATMLAGYLSLHNLGDRPLRIVGASASAFAAVEIHRTEESGGMARMRAVDAFEVGAGETVTLAPGGLHLMLMHPSKPLAEGSTVVVDLLTEGGDALPAVLKVRRGGPGEDEHADHAHHDH